MFGSTIFFYLLPLFGDGPVWDPSLKLIVDGCKNTNALLENFFFLSNFGPLIEKDTNENWVRNS